MFAALFTQEHCLRLYISCLGHCPSHPHQDEQLVNYLVHPFWKMLKEFIWNAAETRCISNVLSSPEICKGHEHVQAVRCFQTLTFQQLFLA